MSKQCVLVSEFSITPMFVKDIDIGIIGVSWTFNICEARRFDSKKAAKVFMKEYRIVGVEIEEVEENRMVQTRYFVYEDYNDYKLHYCSDISILTRNNVNPLFEGSSEEECKEFIDATNRVVNFKKFKKITSPNMYEFKYNFETNMWECTKIPQPKVKTNTDGEWFVFKNKSNELVASGIRGTKYCWLEKALLKDVSKEVAEAFVEAIDYFDTKISKSYYSVLESKFPVDSKDGTYRFVYNEDEGIWKAYVVYNNSEQISKIEKDVEPFYKKWKLSRAKSTIEEELEQRFENIQKENNEKYLDTLSKKLSDIRSIVNLNSEAITSDAKIALIIEVLK